MAFKNSTLFFIPVWFDDYRNFISAMEKSTIWAPTPLEDITPRYFLNYVTQIATTPEGFVPFR